MYFINCNIKECISDALIKIDLNIMNISPYSHKIKSYPLNSQFNIILILGKNIRL